MCIVYGKGGRAAHCKGCKSKWKVWRWKGSVLINLHSIQFCPLYNNSVKIMKRQCITTLYNIYNQLKMLQNWEMFLHCSGKWEGWSGRVQEIWSGERMVWYLHKLFTHFQKCHNLGLFHSLRIADWAFIWQISIFSHTVWRVKATMLPWASERSLSGGKG